MKKSRTYPEYTKMHLKPAILTCPHCGGRLKYVHWIVDKFVVTLLGVLHVLSEGWSCSNTQCREQHGKIVYQSEQTHQYALPNATFGLDVVAYVGFERSRNHRNFEEIHQDLTEQSVPISSRNVNYLYKSFEYLLRCSLKERINELKPEFIKNGGIILSVDGLQPQQGHDLLFVLRDTLTREVLHAELMHDTNTEAMAKLFSVIKDSGVPVKGIISDGQKSIRKAKDEIFPEVPYQLCTYHYIKDLGKPVGAQDLSLRKEVKKNSGDCAQ